MALFIYPHHIATRGRFDGEYGIATRGYIVCPDLVSRFPVFGEVHQSRLFATVDEFVLEALLRDAGLYSELWDLGDMDAILGLSRVLTASVSDEGDELSARVGGALDEMLATVECLDDTSANLLGDAMVAEMSQSGDEATVSDSGDDLAVVEDTPGDGAWKRSGKPC